MHPDEPILWAYSQQINLGAGKLDPKFYNYGTLPLTLNSITNSLVGAYGGASEDPYATMRNEHLAARVLTAFAGSGVVVLVFLVLNRKTNLLGAVFGALAVLFAPGMMVHSRFQTVDMLSVLWVTWALWFSVRANDADEIDWKAILGVGVMAGLAAGTKYSGVLVLASLLPLVRFRGKAIAPLMVAGLTAAVVFLVTTPGALLNNAKFMEDFRYEMWHTSAGHGLVFVGTGPAAVVHVANIAEAIGGLILLLSVIGVGAGLYLWIRKDEKPDRWLVGLLLFAAMLFIVLSRAEIKFLRYVLPLIPVIGVLFGLLIGRAHSSTNIWSRVAIALGFFGVAGVGQGGLTKSVELTGYMLNEDVRDRAGRELLREATGTIGLVSDSWFYSPTLYPDAQATRAIPVEKRLELQHAAADGRIVQFVGVDPSGRADWDPKLLTELQPEFVVFSSFETEGYERLVRMKTVPAELQSQVERYTAFSRLLQENYGLHQEYGAGGPITHDMMYIRPRLWVWKRLKPISTNSSMNSGPNGAPANTP